MATYRVTWEIDLEANSPREAAEQAQEIQRDPNSIATVFAVSAWADTKGLVKKPTVMIDVQLNGEEAS